MADEPDPRYQDLLGREYARLSKLKVGDKIETDGGFDCIAGSSLVDVIDVNGELAFACAQGSHALAGQLADDGDHLIGIFPVDMTPRGSAP